MLKPHRRVLTLIIDCSLTASHDLQVRPELVVKHHVQPIGLPDVQALVLWTIADYREGSNPKWAFLKASFLKLPAQKKWEWSCHEVHGV